MVSDVASHTLAPKRWSMLDLGKEVLSGGWGGCRSLRILGDGISEVVEVVPVVCLRW